MNRSFCSSVAVCALVAVAGGVMAGGDGGVVLYDIDFSAPFHTGGTPVSIDTGATPREGFSGYFITDPSDEAVVDDVFALRAISGGVARFENNAQALLEVGNSFGGGIPGAAYDEYILEFNAIVPQLGSMTVFFDAPAINLVTFYRPTPGTTSGVVQYNSFEDAVELATYTFGEFLAVRMVLNIAEQNWSIEVDGELLYDGVLQNPATALNDVRFSVGAPVILDNITLVGRNAVTCGVADVNEDGILDLSDINAFVAAFTGGCNG